MTSLLIRSWWQWITNFNFRPVSYKHMKGAGRELELTFWPWKCAKEEWIWDYILHFQFTIRKYSPQNEVCSLGGDQLGFGIIRVFFQLCFGTEGSSHSRVCQCQDISCTIKCKTAPFIKHGTAGAGSSLLKHPATKTTVSCLSFSHIHNLI